MNLARKSPISREQVESLKTVPIASKSVGKGTYHPSSRTVSAIVPVPEFRESPGFVVEESAARGISFYCVATLEEVAAVFAEPLA